MKIYLVSAEDGKLQVREVDSYKKRDYTYESFFKFTTDLHLWGKKDKLLDKRTIGDDSGTLKRVVVFDPNREISINTDPGYKPVTWRG